MRHIKTILVAALLVLGGCVELTGQRIAWSYDPATDTLTALVFYDGIHNSDAEGIRAARQLERFVDSGSVMLIDWYAHFELDKIRGATDDPNADADTRALAEAIKDVTVEAIGHYREPDGRIGAAQRITIGSAKKVLTQINAAINRRIVREANNGNEIADAEWVPNRTQKMIRDAAAAGHSWIAIDGHAMRISVPIHNGEWAKQKANLLTELMKIDGGDRNAEQAQGMRMLRQLLAASAVSYTERAGAIDITIGRTDEPTLLRLNIRDDYEANLDRAVIEHVPVYLDKRINDWVSGGKVGEAPAGVAELLTFGPPEAQVLALIGMTQRPDPADKTQGLQGLRSFALRWNAADRLPAAPARHQDIDEWKAWYDRMKHWPVSSPRDEEEDEFDE